MRLQGVRVEAFAKINLGLAVTAVRPDGYHDIETLFQSVSLSDTLALAPLKGPGRVSLEVRGIPVPSGADNLAWRAAEAVLGEFGLGE